MTIKVSKPAINIREELADLKQDTGLKGQELMRANTAQEARTAISAGRKNLIINGAMRVDQRNAAAATIATGYAVDRFTYGQAAISTGVITAQQVSDAPAGFDKSLKLTVTTADTSLAAGDWYDISHTLEGNNTAHLKWGTSEAKDVTLSFWVKASVVGTYGMELRSTQGTSVSYTFDYEVPNIGWNKIEQQIPGSTIGTWDTDNSANLCFIIPIGTGSTYSTTTTDVWQTGNYNASTSVINLLATVNATFQITGFQLEVGSVATEFEHRSYGEELALCQRYLYVIDGATGGDRVGDAFSYSTTGVVATIPFPVKMRAKPTLEGTPSQLTFNDSIAGTDSSAISLNSSNTHFGSLSVTVSATAFHGGQVYFTNTAANTIIFKAEI